MHVRQRLLAHRREHVVALGRVEAVERRAKAGAEVALDGDPAVERGEGHDEVDDVDLVLAEAGAVEPLRDDPGAAPGELARRVGVGALGMTATDQLPRRERGPRVVGRRRPDRERDATAGAQDAPRLAQRRLAVGHQHVAPAAEHAVERCRGLVDRLGVDLAEAHVGDPEPLGPCLGGGDHLGHEVRGDERAAGRDLLGGEKADLARARRQLEQLVPGLEPERVDHPDGHRHRHAGHPLGLCAPARGLRGPAGAALLAVVVGLAHVSSRRSSLPEGVRGSRLASSNAFGTL